MSNHLHTHHVNLRSWLQQMAPQTCADLHINLELQDGWLLPVVCLEHAYAVSDSSTIGVMTADISCDKSSSFPFVHMFRPQSPV